MYNFKIDRPGLAPGTELQINGLGIVENGKTKFISKEDAEAFRAANQIQLSETDENGNMEVWNEPGPTLLQAFKDDPDVTVEVIKSKPAKAKEPEQDVPMQTGPPTVGQDPNPNDPTMTSDGGEK